MIRGIIKPLIAASAKSPASLRQFADALRKKDPSIANAFERAQQSLDMLEAILRATPEAADEFVFTDSQGNILVWFGSRSGYFGGWLGQIYVGGTGPADAPFWVDTNGIVNIGKYGAIQVLDPAGNSVGEIGVTTEADKTVLTATNATPVVIGITSHGYENGDTVVIYGATGNTAINGYRLVKSATTHTFAITDFAGANIVGNGAYAGPGKCFRYFGGSRFETFAIGTSFPAYKLRAFADGSLKIKDALITLTGATSIITLDPATGAITITPNPTTGRILTLNAQKIELLDRDGLAVFRIIDNERPPTGIPPPPTEGNVIWTDTGAGAIYALEVKASGCVGTGAVVRLVGMNGTKPVPTATGVGDFLGTIMFDGYLSGQAYIRATQKSATETQITLSTTTSGVSYARMRADELGVTIPSSGSLNVPGGYIAVGGARVSSNVLTVVGSSYLNGAVELNSLTASLPLKLSSGKIVTAAKIDVGAAADIAATGFSDGDFAKWDATAAKFVPITLASLAADLATYFSAAAHTHSTPDGALTNSDGLPAHTHSISALITGDPL